MAERIKLGVKDRDRYGGPEELVFDMDTILDMESEEIIALEEEMDFSIQRLRHIEIRGGSAEGIKARAWLARQLSGDPGLKLPGYKKFVIQPFKVEITQVAAAPLAPPESALPAPESSTVEQVKSSTGSSRAARSESRSTS